ncbi:hypothetical protein LEP1GSC170_2086 [Leptospira interrogans serovar Bataviae str. HAI135]|nr:hypothetical protein LEP1GSC170_2086 [Leptospira interrogans serovar Bataviae str. HAI135]
MTEVAILKIDGKEYELPIVIGTEKKKQSIFLNFVNRPDT